MGFWDDGIELVRFEEIFQYLLNEIVDSNCIELSIIVPLLTIFRNLEISIKLNEIIRKKNRY